MQKYHFWIFAKDFEIWATVFFRWGGWGGVGWVGEICDF